MSLDALQHRVGYVFLDTDLLQTALTHRSLANETNVPDNERLEFLGDAVLQLAASELLVKRFPKAREGELSKLRSRLVNGEALATIAGTLGLSEMILLGVGEEKTGGRQNARNLGNVTEAVLGAIFVDGGYQRAAEVAQAWVRDRLKVLNDRKVDLGWRDPKSALQERIQNERRLTPEYREVGRTGPDHAPTYTVEVFAGDERLAHADGSSFKAATKAAAMAALERLG